MVIKSKASLRYILTVIVLFFGAALITGAANNNFSMFVLPVTNELGISRGVFSIASSLSSLAAVFGSALAVVISRRFGYKMFSIAYCTILFVIYFIYSRTNSVFSFYVGFFLNGLLTTSFFGIGLPRIINKWFDSNRGTILGIVMSASGLGASVLALALTPVMEKYSWRTVYLVHGFLAVFVAIIYFIFLADSPEQVGLSPYKADTQKKAKSLIKEHNYSWDGVSLQELKRKPFFYLTMAAILLCSLSTYGVYPNMIAHMTDNGFLATDSAACYSFMMLTLAVAKIIMGVITDRFGAIKGFSICLICNMFSIFCFINGDNMIMNYLSAFFMAFALCLSSFFQPLLTDMLFGHNYFSEILGVQLMVVNVGVLIASPLANFLYDSIGSYTPIFKFEFVLSVIVLIMFLLAFTADKQFRHEKGADWN